MKIITIGDIHGRLDWKKVDPIKYDKIIFVGDYVDSFVVSDTQIVENLLDIIQFKKDNMDKVVLLWGNHDIQYYLGRGEYLCSGYRPQMYVVLHTIFKDNKDLFRLAFEHKNTIWTHAGIHQGWYINAFKSYPGHNLANKLNNAFDNRYTPIFHVGHSRGGWYDVGGPLWCDRSELTNKPLRGINQIVGHSRINRITTVYKYNVKLVFVDVLEDDADVKFYETEI